MTELIKMSAENDTTITRRLSLPRAGSVLLVYQFVMPLLLEYLSDQDVLQTVLVTGKVMRPSLIAYRVKSGLILSQAREFAGCHRYLPVQPTRICDWNGEDLHFCTALKQLENHQDFNRFILPGELPSSLQVIRFNFSGTFNQPITQNVLPPHLKRLYLGDNYNQPLQVGALPSSLEFVDFGHSFDQEVLAGMIPHGVSEIEFGDSWGRTRFHKPLPPGAIPDSVTRLTLNPVCSSLLLPGSLPSSLTSLTLKRTSVIIPIPFDLPFDHRFHHSLTPGILPNSLTELCLSHEFKQPLFPNTFPSRLKRLELDFNQPLTEDVMPSHLEYLALGDRFANSLWLPETLITLELQCSIADITFINPLPLSLHRVELFRDPEQLLPVGLLPPSVKVLIVTQGIQIGSISDGVIDFTYRGSECRYEIPVGAIPASVKRLRFGSGFDQPVPAGVIPDSVTHLMFGYNFNQILSPGDIPTSVAHIRFGKEFSQMLMPGALPDSVTHLIMDRDFGEFDMPLAVMNDHQPSSSSSSGFHIPRSVTHLILSHDFNQPLCAGALPNSITHIAFGDCFNQPLTNDVLPRSLQQLHLSDNGPVIATAHLKANVFRSDTWDTIEWCNLLVKSRHSIFP